MLPFFGNVRAWMMTPDDIVLERPGPPPSTSSELMARELAEVRRQVDRGTRDGARDRQPLGRRPQTPTPPGHWNFIAAPYIRKAELSEVRAARAFALLNMALHDAAVGCWDTKYFYFNPRPSHLDPDLKSVIGLPNFPSYTSGHSTFSGAAAEVLSYLFPKDASVLRGSEGRGLDLPAVRRHPLSLRPRSRQGARPSDRPVHGAICPGRRRRRPLADRPLPSPPTEPFSVRVATKKSQKFAHFWRNYPFP